MISEQQRLLTIADCLKMAKEKCEVIGGVRLAAIHLGVSPQLVYRALVDDSKSVKTLLRIMNELPPFDDHYSRRTYILCTPSQDGEQKLATRNDNQLIIF